PTASANAGAFFSYWPPRIERPKSQTSAWGSHGNIGVSARENSATTGQRWLLSEGFAAISSGGASVRAATDDAPGARERQRDHWRTSTHRYRRPVLRRNRGDDRRRRQSREDSGCGDAARRRIQASHFALLFQ